MHAISERVQALNGLRANGQEARVRKAWRALGEDRRTVRTGTRGGCVDETWTHQGRRALGEPDAPSTTPRARRKHQGGHDGIRDRERRRLDPNALRVSGPETARRHAPVGRGLRRVARGVALARRAQRERRGPTESHRSVGTQLGSLRRRGLPEKPTGRAGNANPRPWIETASGGLGGDAQPAAVNEDRRFGPLKSPGRTQRPLKKKSVGNGSRSVCTWNNLPDMQRSIWNRGTPGGICGKCISMNN